MPAIAKDLIIALGVLALGVIAYLRIVRGPLLPQPANRVVQGVTAAIVVVFGLFILLHR